MCHGFPSLGIAGRRFISSISLLLRLASIAIREWRPGDVLLCQFLSFVVGYTPFSRNARQRWSRHGDALLPRGRVCLRALWLRLAELLLRSRSALLALFLGEGLLQDVPLPLLVEAMQYASLWGGSRFRKDDLDFVAAPFLGSTWCPRAALARLGRLMLRRRVPRRFVSGRLAGSWCCGFSYWNRACSEW